MLAASNPIKIVSCACDGGQNYHWTHQHGWGRIQWTKHA